jgi:anti-anti-sigma factor
MWRRRHGIGRAMSADEQLHIATRQGLDRLILELEGELDMVSSGLLEETLASADLDGSRAVVLDLRGVRFLDSTGLKAIFRVRNLVREGGRQFAVTHGSVQVQRLLSLTGLDGYLLTIPTPDAAVFA